MAGGPCGTTQLADSDRTYFQGSWHSSSDIEIKTFLRRLNAPLEMAKRIPRSGEMVFDNFEVTD